MNTMNIHHQFKLIRYDISRRSKKVKYTVNKKKKKEKKNAKKGRSAYTVRMVCGAKRI